MDGGAIGMGGGAGMNAVIGVETPLEGVPKERSLKGILKASLGHLKHLCSFQVCGEEETPQYKGADHLQERHCSCGV